jgi:Methyltransferase domain
LEVGVAGGASLELWQALFPAGLVVGVDHNPNAIWPDGTVRVVASQDDPALPAELAAHAPYGFDLVVDDASHDGRLTRRTFELLWPLVAPGRWYVIEDWQVGFDGIGWDVFDDSMLTLARGLLDALNHPDGEVAEVTYRFGMILLRKRAGRA